MIVVVAPPGALWVPMVVEAAGKLGRTRVISPSATLLWRLADLPVRAWSRGRAGRLIVARLLRRAVLDRLAARTLPHDVTVVIAPSCGARETLAAARRRGARCILVQDLPALRRLHADLDDAVRRHPDCAFLRRYRAPARVLARQEAEWVLADRVLVRGRYALAALADAGVPQDRLEAFALPTPTPTSTSTATPTPMPTTAGRMSSTRIPGRILLAGLATGRNGSVEAAAAVARLPNATLLVRAGEGLEPHALLDRPFVEHATEGALERLEGVDAVLAPAWCESYSKQVALACAAGVPVVGTARALAFAASRTVTEVPVGDVDAIVAALSVPPGARRADGSLRECGPTGRVIPPLTDTLV